MSRPAPVILALAGSIVSTSAAAATITVNVEGFNPANGALAVSLCTRQQFARRSCPIVLTAPARLGQAPFVFNDVPQGRYVATAYQDANHNGRLDLDLLGRPAEPAALSGARTIIPNFDKAAFSVQDHPVIVTVRRER